MHPRLEADCQTVNPYNLNSSWILTIVSRDELREIFDLQIDKMFKLIDEQLSLLERDHPRENVVRLFVFGYESLIADRGLNAVVFSDVWWFG